MELKKLVVNLVKFVYNLNFIAFYLRQLMQIYTFGELIN